MHVVHTRVLQPHLDNSVSLAAATAARNGTSQGDEAPIPPIFMTHEKMVGNKRAAWRDIEMKIELPSHQLVGHLELMTPLVCCRCAGGGQRRTWCSRVICYSVAYAFADLDIQLLKLSAASSGRDPKVKGSRRRGGKGSSAQDYNRSVSELSAIRLDFESHTIFGSSSHTRVLHMEEASGVFRLLSAIQNESKVLEQGRGGSAGRTRRRR